MSAVHFGDCSTVMQQLIDAGTTVQCCVTSPPYWGLRDYGHPEQMGMEDSPAEYIDSMVEAFALVYEMLADDGTLWLNVGDTYNSAPGPNTQNGLLSNRKSSKCQVFRSPNVFNGLKTKDLVGIPWRLALALQDAGWYLRQDIIWHKPNPMPESVRDRCTKAHEYIFLLSKSPQYYFDHAAIKEPVAESTAARLAQDIEAQAGSNRVPGKTNGAMKAVGDGKTRNKRSVWTVSTKPYKGAHFAVFPPDLIRPCILAGSRAGDTVLDPFFGSGTTGQVCNELGREYIGIELNRDYEPLQQARTAQQSMNLDIGQHCQEVG